MMQRRKFLTTLGISSGVVLGANRLSAGATGSKGSACCAGDSSHRYKVAVCDWMILRRQHPGAFKRASEIGADGVELDMGGLGNRETFNSKLFDPLQRRQFLNEAAQHEQAIASIAMSGFYGQSFAEREGVVEHMVTDCINTMNLLNVKVAFLPLGVPSNLAGNPQLRPVVVERLRKAGAMAEAAGVVIGVETMLDAAGDVELLAEIDSPGIKCYMNFANAIAGDRDICEELKILGSDRLCQIHCSDTDGVWIENNPKLDMPAIKATLDSMGWRGWLVIERSRDVERVRDVIGNYGANARYLKSVFQTNPS